MTTLIQLHRIEVLIEELTKLRQRSIDRGREIEFYMGNWITTDLCSPHLKDKITKAVRNPCGTQACLAGKAGLIPRIRRLGFKFDIVPGSYGAKAEFQYTENGITWSENSAIRMFFGEDVTKKIFIGSQDIHTLFQGIQALKRFVKANS